MTQTTLALEIKVHVFWCDMACGRFIKTIFKVLKSMLD